MGEGSIFINHFTQGFPLNCLKYALLLCINRVKSIAFRSWAPAARPGFVTGHLHGPGQATCLWTSLSTSVQWIWINWSLRSLLDLSFNILWFCSLDFSHIFWPPILCMKQLKPTYVCTCPMLAILPGIFWSPSGSHPLLHTICNVTGGSESVSSHFLNC